MIFVLIGGRPIIRSWFFFSNLGSEFFQGALTIHGHSSLVQCLGHSDVQAEGTSTTLRSVPKQTISSHICISQSGSLSICFVCPIESNLMGRRPLWLLWSRTCDAVCTSHVLLAILFWFLRLNASGFFFYLVPLPIAPLFSPHASPSLSSCWCSISPVLQGSSWNRTALGDSLGHPPFQGCGAGGRQSWPSHLFPLCQRPEAPDGSPLFHLPNCLQPPHTKRSKTWVSGATNLLSGTSSWWIEAKPRHLQGAFSVFQRQRSLAAPHSPSPSLCPSCVMPEGHHCEALHLGRGHLQFYGAQGAP